MLKYQINDTDLDRVFETVSTMYEAAEYLLEHVAIESTVKQMTGQMDLLLQQLSQFLYDRLGHDTDCSVLKLLQCLKTSILRVHINAHKTEWVCGKVQYEVIPIIEEIYHYSYFWFYASRGETQMQEYLNILPTLCSNQYICAAEESGVYKYDIAFVILAYNNLNYTKWCVESLLRDIPIDLNFELILVNHGSTDGTQEYFESIHPTKQIDVAVNGVGFHLAERVIESEYMLGISNDVVIGKNVVKNLLTCIRSDSKIAYVVPTTPNIANFQSISASYKDLSEMYAFSAANNISDPYRWEQRVRLCDPIAILRSCYFFGKNGIYNNRLFGDGNYLAFPDDRLSLILRRKGYKLLLAKDAYCHHFGSVTLKSDIQKVTEEKLYLEGRRAFYSDFGVDPWGTGFCFDRVFLQCVIQESHQHQRILGINCGLGSNSLKIKEQFKEYYHNVDVELVNVTDEAVFLPDLSGISDYAYLCTSMDDFKHCISGGAFHYIVWENAFLSGADFSSLLSDILSVLTKDGVLMIKQNEKNQSFLASYQQCHIGDGWYVLKDINK